MADLGILLVPFIGVLGLAIGSFLNVVIYRVPAGIPLSRESRCPHCDVAIHPSQNVPIVSWLVLRGRCANCNIPISARYPLIEGATAGAFATVAWWFSAAADFTSVLSVWAFSFELAAFLYLAAISIALTMIDLETRRLPNAIVLPSYLVAGFLLALAALFGGDWTSLARAGIGMAALYGFYFVLRLVRPDGMGGGDVKLAGVVGLYLGWVGWGALSVGAFAAFLVGGVVGIALIAARRAGRKSALPFGPFMILGAWIGITSGEALGRAYLSLYSGT